MTNDGEVEPVPFIFIDFEPEAAKLPYAGCLEITTESKTRYLVDLEAEFLCRLRGTEQPDDPEVALASHLRRDGDHLRLLRVVSLELDRPAIFDLQALRPDAAFTRRITTRVTQIRELGGSGDWAGKPEPR